MSDLEQPPLTTDDIYCELILPGRLAVDIVAETERVLAFHHTRPVESFHVVVIPKLHVRNLVELEDLGLAAEILGVIRDVARAHRLEESAFRVVTNGGS